MRDIRLDVVQRSLMFMPVNVPRFVESAWRRETDVVVLDLEDSVPPAEKERARALVRDAIPLAGRGGAEVYVRVNNEAGLLAADLDAALWPGLSGVHLPKPESPEQMAALCESLARLEKERGILPRTVQVASLIETPGAFFQAREIAAACPRLVGYGVAPEDLPRELGFEPTDGGEELLYARQHMIFVCAEAGVQPRGLMGDLANFTDLDAYRRSAERAAAFGFMGAYCIHPRQAPILNAAFSPQAAEVEKARRVAAAFEEGMARGTASVAMDGKMIDIPIAGRARRLIARAEAVARREREKQTAREKAEV